MPLAGPGRRKADPAGTVVARRTRSRVMVRRERAAAAPPEGVPLEIPLPQREGVYDVLFTAMYASSWPRSVASALNWKRTVAERKVQLVVIDPRRPPPGRLGEFEPGGRDRFGESAVVGPESEAAEVDAVDAMEQDFRGQRRHADRPARAGRVTQLNPSGSPPDVSWHAYTLSLSQPGRPHVLEVEYPSDTPQTLGLSIVEPNAAGVPAPIGLDSGFDVGEEPVKDTAPHWATHRLVFWPRTASPALVVTNQRSSKRACTGRFACWPDGSICPRGGAPPPRNVCWRPTWTAPCSRKTSPPPSRSTLGAAAACTIGTPSATAACGWSNTCTTSATTA